MYIISTKQKNDIKNITDTKATKTITKTQNVFKKWSNKQQMGSMCLLYDDAAKYILLLQTCLLHHNANYKNKAHCEKKIMHYTTTKIIFSIYEY